MTTTLSTLFFLLGFSGPPASEPAASSDTPTDSAADSATDPATDPAVQGEPESPSEAAQTNADEGLPTVRLLPEAQRPDEAHPAANGASESAGGPGPRRSLSPEPVTTHGGGEVAEKSWGFEFNGYLNAPMQLGIGEHPDTGRTTLHAPLVADDQFLSWQHTSHMRRSWSELYFSVGNDVARGTAVIEAFNFTDVAWNQQQAQLGIGQAFVTLAPRFRNSAVRLRARVGAFDNRYGMSGRYDVGEYETYIFGRTRAMGETVSVAIPIKKFTINLEHGFGVNRPNPSIYNTSRFTVLNHAHAGVEWNDKVEFNFHYLAAYAMEEDRRGELNPENRRGRMQVFGPELRVNANRAGYWYLGFSIIDANKARTVGPAIEVIHAQGGGNFTLGVVDNYLEGPTQQSDGDGGVYTLGLQTEHSLKKILEGDSFWGAGWDVRLTVYGMLNFIDSPDPDVDGTHKLKYGADLFYSALPWLGAALRFDRVQPHSSLPDQSFAIFSPRLVFRSSWLTREQIYIQYSRYFYAQRECADPAEYYFCVQPPVTSVLPDGWGAASLDNDRGSPLNLPDYNVITIGANIWW
ncbi:hypothetical protein DB30_07403 [Enhygromyxa salina]|uniref:Maltoporin n=1 Tax=Enhygromyxa salina TaxID=215803 RepID=A0A0C2D1F1_9BACT|nr:hypothetical protein [Enhygromyxa salina]KIG13987.1 hypothetical protein DB30_07403 [Enhygromyxa salina]